MAWRDSRRDRMRVMAFSISIMVGIAVLTAAGSLKENLLRMVDEESRALLGADAMLESRKEFSAEAEKVLATIPGERKRELAWVTAVSFPGSSKGSGFVQLRGAEKGWPFHGTPTTDPPDAWARCQAGEGFVAARPFVENTGAKTGQLIRAGKVELPLLGVFVRPPPMAAGPGLIVPEVHLSLDRLREAQPGGMLSMVVNRTWLELPRDWSADRDVEDRHQAVWRKAEIRVITLEERKTRARELLELAMSFVSLVGFVSAVLGGLGVASAMSVHAAQRAPAAAMLRCLGGEAHRVTAVYLLQGVWLGLCGAAGGVLLGMGLQALVPLLLPDGIPMDVRLILSPRAVITAVSAGFLLCASFAALPMLAVQRVPPLAALRASADMPDAPRPGHAVLWWLLWLAGTVALIVLAVKRSSRVWAEVRTADWAKSLAASREDFLAAALLLVVLLSGFLAACRLLRVRGAQWVVAAILSLAMTALAVELSPAGRAWLGLGQAAGIGLGLAVLALCGTVVVWLARLIIRPGWPFTLRQGFASLFRPRNQTRLFLLSGGMAAALVLTMIMTQEMLVRFLEGKFTGSTPTVMLSELPPDQRGTMLTLAAKHGLQIIEDRPVVSVRLTALKGKSLDEATDPRGRPLGRWMRDPFRATLSATLPNDDRVTDGEFTGTHAGGPDQPAGISVESEVASQLGLRIGDSLTFLAGEEEVPCTVTSIRTVQKAAVQFWFRIVFPAGRFNEAELVRQASAHGTDEATGAFIGELRTSVPAVLAFDVGDILRILLRLIRQVTAVIASLAAFILTTGLVILVAVIAAGKQARIRETVLLRTLGASRRQVIAVLSWEYLFLGLLAGAAGALIACVWAWLLATRVFTAGNLPADFSVPWGIVGTGLGIMALLTLTAGWIFSRGVTRHPPLAILREL